MKYFIDTEFLEGTQKTFFGKSKPTIDLISIGLVSEDGREFYAISKEFNLKEAWNRYQLKEVYGDARNLYPEGIKEYWIRENVLKPIFSELSKKDDNIEDSTVEINGKDYAEYNFTYRNFKRLVSKYGKTKKQIAEDIKGFIYTKEDVLYNHERCSIDDIGCVKSNIELYGYYCDYDWVCFCWLFGKMISLPQGFPMYCRDLKQELDRCQKNLNRLKENGIEWKTIKGIDDLKLYPNYPKQLNEHNALADAKWTFELYKFLEQL